MSIDDLTEVLAQEDVPLVITRTSAINMVNGRQTGATTSTISIMAVVQPVPTKELQFWPDGLSNRGLVKIFSPVELLVLPLPDTFPYKGATWELVKCDDWSDIANYYRCFAARVTLT